MRHWCGSLIAARNLTAGGPAVCYRHLFHEKYDDPEKGSCDYRNGVSLTAKPDGAAESA
ncbi:protein of unknown function (plasmid) [Cupriavidus taiwanensis]|uniref:Uncharacterized protein n=1 Tax=Cupriavidus taiwanensis TaxID=164546 RepID=A0A375ISX8_9BURK|nr:protein of unknown function [Cupriavidus taiwanensis]